MVLIIYIEVINIILAWFGTASPYKTGSPGLAIARALSAFIIAFAFLVQAPTPIVNT